MKKDETIKNNKRGRPSKKEDVDLETLAILASFGLTDDQLSKALKISLASLKNYKKDPEFLAALKKGKEISDSRVERSLYERATGYEHPDLDIRVVKNRIVKTKIIKHYPPDATSAIFWLKNRKPDEWREKNETKIGLDGKTVELILSALPPDYAAAVRRKLMEIKEC